MDSLLQAIEATLAYSGFFDFPITINELSKNLISARIYSTDNIKEVLKTKRLPPKYRRWLVSDLSRTRVRRLSVSNTKLQYGRLIAQKIAMFPTVKLVAATGSLAAQNAVPSSDIDLMVITSASTLWITRPLVLLWVSLWYRRRTPGKLVDRDAVCLNLWLDTRALAVPEALRNIYTAHEVLQLVPLYERKNTYQRFLRANSWVRQFMANAYAAKRVAGKTPRTVKLSRIKVVHWWAVLNKILFKLQYWYMKPKMTREVVTLHSAYFHPKDWAKELNVAVRLA